ncbi:hypothetical protein PPL_00436 [Heterostelium album PN500]|uniref:DUF7107 domain-containing protein n=1 Tax=Heterostelium pallidum (strain ATCC 26659 / Pp 5 / PN500) TaxID=670386 RepID=D3AWG2_HETP5|nr:hypothetical protein PPL_00436 [Heterostelium album PN500]EFA86635.1 hypothetical protein PPL_00436 [Heterostelium album PN500]|eukprot:XP_020438740.1 hypothetical protein PPL_00436 [Heterostelium album PN500]
MYRNYLLVLVLLVLCIITKNGGVVFAGVDDQCMTCRSNGQTCDRFPDRSICQDGSDCRQSNGTFTCKKIPTLGESCVDTQYCYGGYYCSKGICIKAYYLGFNETCVNDLDCATGLKCLNTTNRCTNEIYPSCSADTMCKPDEVCVDDKCVVALADGGSCQVQSDCDVSQKLICSNGICIGSDDVEKQVCSMEPTESKYECPSYSLLLLCTLSISMGAGICLRCLNVGDVCNPDASVCPVGSKCIKSGSNSSKCLQIPAPGADCSVLQVCADGYSCSANTSTCIATNYLGYGEKCSNDYECTSGLQCQGTCINEDYPKCDDRGDCKPGQVCSQGTCTKVFADGDPCKADSECKMSRSCLLGVCTLPLTVKEGGDCFNSLSCDLSSNLLCLQGTCTADEVDIKCSMDPKNYDTFCPDLSTCMCSGASSNTTGKCRASTNMSPDDFTPYFDCLEKTKCPFVSNILKTSCLYECQSLSPLNPTEKYNNLCNISTGNSLKRISILSILTLLISCYFIL